MKNCEHFMPTPTLLTLSGFKGDPVKCLWAGRDGSIYIQDDLLCTALSLVKTDKISYLKLKLKKKI